MPSTLSSHPIPPHGGTLVERLIDEDARPELVREALSLPRLPISRRELSDIRMLGIGAYSPLEGFMDQAEYDRVVTEMRLTSGLVWTIPVTLAVGAVEAHDLKHAPKITLTYKDRPVATVEITEIYQPDKTVEAREVYGVDDPRHPGVRAVYEQGEYYIGGRVNVLDLALDDEGELATYYLTPKETRRIFAERGWNRVVAFQTRNPIHRAHEYLQKCALEIVDGLLIHPLAGATKDDDIDVVTRFACYRRLIHGYYPADRVASRRLPCEHALRRPPRGRLSRAVSPELRLHPLDRRPRPRRRRQLLRHLRRPKDL